MWEIYWYECSSEKRDENSGDTNDEEIPKGEDFLTVFPLFVNAVRIGKVLLDCEMRWLLFTFADTFDVVCRCRLRDFSFSLMTEWFRIRDLAFRRFCGCCGESEATMLTTSHPTLNFNVGLPAMNVVTGKKKRNFIPTSTARPNLLGTFGW